MASPAPPADPFAALLQRARAIAADVLVPRAEQSDQADGPPVDNLRALGAAGLLGLTTPARYGGQEAPLGVVRAYNETIAAACGVTSFIQLQHLSACKLVAGGENAAIKAARLPALAAGTILCGVAFSHLRRPGPPAVRAVPADDGWVLDGMAPWFTGWGAMQEVVLGGTLPDGRLLYVLAPLVGSAGLSASDPLRLCAMNASGTVTLTCQGLHVGRERYLRTTTVAEMAAHDREAILDLTWQPFAVATASIALLRGLAPSRDMAALTAAADALEDELASLRADVDAWLPRTAAADFPARALALRAWSIELGVRAAHAAVAATGGGAIALTSAAQRRYREALVYTVLMQTHDVQTATLAHLTHDARAAAAAGARE
jgi:alkylation response protein AidB-like acyl-CoA dehydrogenase